MASAKIIEGKQNVVDEITSKLDNSKSVLVVEYQGTNVSDMSDLRGKLREANGELKIYKNTLATRALDSKNLKFENTLEGANAFVFGETLLEPIKIISEFAKSHDTITVKAGIIDGEIVGLDTINEYASIPSMEGLLTMLAGGMIEHVKNLSIGLNLYAEKLGEEN